MVDDKTPFWQTLPGILTAIGGVIGATAALVTALHLTGVIGKGNGDATPTIAPASAPTGSTSASMSAAPNSSATSAPSTASSTNPPPAVPAAPPPVLANHSFAFPGDGVKNNNGYIGPFCCTGETATLTLSDGSVIGYIYFYDFEEAGNFGNGGSGARVIKILVSTTPDLENPNAAPVTGTIRFAAANSRAGTVQRVRVGRLQIQATVLSDPLKTGDGPRFDMGSFRAQLNVELADN